ncbi:MAG: thrombospondin type 3 repeat-containing protein [Gammaproteobacteria bacterium]
MKTASDQVKIKRFFSLATHVLVTSMLCFAALYAHASGLNKVSISQPELLFEENKGQFPASVDYVARGEGYSVILGTSPVVELFRYSDKGASKTATLGEQAGSNVQLQSFVQLRLNVLDARQEARAMPNQRNRALTHYLLGSQTDWQTDVPNYERVKYSEILPKIDVEYYGREGRLEYDFVVKPGGDPEPIKFTFEGADALRIDDKGDLVITVGNRELVQRAPYSYQTNEAGEQQVVSSKYTLDDDVIGFEVSAWDETRTLTIDPVLEYSRYFGGAKFDRPSDVELDAAGNIYVISDSTSSGLATPGVYNESLLGARKEITSLLNCSACDDVSQFGQVERSRIGISTNLLITKFSPDGQTILWSTYFNGEAGESIDLGVNSTGVSASGEVAFGVTRAQDGLPVQNETQSWTDTQQNVYVAKLNSAGNALVFGTYLHTGSFLSWVRGLDVSDSGEVLASGIVGLDNSFPVAGGLSGQSCVMNADEQERTDGFVVLFDSAGTLSFSSCLGGEIADGSSIEGLRGAKFGSNGDLYVAGYRAMVNFPVVTPIQATKNVALAREMTISQINPATNTLVFSTWFGPTTADITPAEFGGFPAFFPYGIEVDSSGNIIVSGSTNSLSYPVVNAFQTNMGVPQNSAQFGVEGFATGVDDTFITKLHPNNGVIFSTYLGGNQTDGGISSLAVDNDDNVYIALVTRSDDFPVLNPIQANKTDISSIALSQFTPDGALAFSTYLGGSNDDVVQAPGGLAVNSAGDIILAGYTRSDDFPIIGSGTSNAGGYDGVLAFIDTTGDVDTDGDGVPDGADAFFEDAMEWRDTDGDLVGDNADTDDDGDGVPDLNDRFPKDNTEVADSDEDGAGDNLDEFDADPGNYFDLDMDSLPDFSDNDSDGDGLDAPDDQFDYDATETVDSDMDGTGDNADTDDDNDGTPDILDIAPLNAQIPIQSFEAYDPFSPNPSTGANLSPWPEGYDEVDGTNLSWTAALDEAYRGQTSFSNRVIDHGQVAAIQYNDNFPEGGLQFWYKVDSQENADVFTFSVDGNIEHTASGDTGWQLFQTTISQGSHTLEWRYTKDDSISVGADAVWFDDLSLDQDGDGVADGLDNCTFAVNPQQRDTDGDGFGNFCDADLNNDCIINFFDLATLANLFLSSDQNADFNGDGSVNFVDLSLFVPFFGLSPGPSDLTTCP